MPTGNNYCVLYCVNLEGNGEKLEGVVVNLLRMGDDFDEYFLGVVPYSEVID